MMLKSTVNDQDQDHQKGKDTTEVTHNVGKVEGRTSCTVLTQILQR